MVRWMVLNLVILSLQSPYHIEEVANGYRFTTNFGIVYELTFLLYPTVNTSKDHCIYMFNIEQIKKGKTTKDDRIRITIEYILGLFFQNNVNAILVVMDTIDSKQEARLRLFKNWYGQRNDNRIEKYEATCQTEDIQLLAMLLIEASNPYKSRILEDYYDLVKINFYS